MTLAAIRRVRVERAEGPSHACGEVLDVATFAEAEAGLRRWSDTAPATGGYDKCDVCVEWDNGLSYAFRYDLKHFTVEPVHLQQELEDGVTCYAGVRKPAHLSELEHQRLLAREWLGPMVEQCRLLHAQCALRDPEPEPETPVVKPRSAKP